MRKCKFITSTLSLTLAIAIGATSFVPMGGDVKKEKLVYEYETSPSIEIVEKSANEVNVLTATKTAANIHFELETTSAPIELKVVKEAEKKAIQKKEAKNKKKKNKKSKKNLKSMGTYKVTAYCSCKSCCGKTNGITASGTKAKEGRTIAADTSVLPFGTKVVINNKTYTVEDRGGAINGKKIDVYFSSHKEALKWGVKYLKVYVKKK